LHRGRKRKARACRERDANRDWREGKMAAVRIKKSSRHAIPPFVVPQPKNMALL
jgi:hypothetical protein